MTGVRLSIMALVLAIGTLALAQNISPWPTYRGNPQHTGASKLEAPAAPKVLWRVKTGAGVEANPIIAQDGTIYAGSTDGKLYAISPDGTLKWTAEATGPMLTPLLLPGGALVVGSLDDHVYSFSPDGKKRWAFKTGGNVEGAPTLGPDGLILFGSADGKLYALTDGGKLAWSYETGGPILGSPAIGKDGLILVGSFDKKLHAVDPKTGKAKWTFVTQDSSDYGIYASVAVDDRGTAFVGNIDRRFYAVAADGKAKWEQKLGSPIITAAAVAGTDSVIVATGKALLRFTGGTRDWAYLAPQVIAGSPSIAKDGVVLVGCDDNSLYAIDAKTGKKRWALDLGGRVASSPTIGPGKRIYVGTDAGDIVAIGEKAD